MQVNNSLIEIKELERRENRTNTVMLVVIVLFCALVLFTRYCWLFCVQVDGDSMLNTLNTGDLLLVDRLDQPDYGDIVVFRRDGKDYIKRLIAKGGDTIKFVAGDVYLKKQGETQFVQVSYGEKGKTYAKVYPFVENQEYVVEENCYYVLGDNRGNSLDSRSFGCVKAKEMKGVVLQWSIENRYTFWSKFFPYL